MKFQGVEVVKVEEGSRISKEEREKHKENNHHVYAMRHGDNDWSIPATIEQGVMINYWGYIVTEEPLDLTQSSGNGSSTPSIELTEDEGYDIVDMRS